MNYVVKEQIVPAMRNLPLAVLGAGMLSIILAGFAGSNLPTMPGDRGYVETDVLADLGVGQDEMVVTEDASLVDDDLMVAADEMVAGGHMFSPELIGGPSIDLPRTASAVSSAGISTELGAQAYVQPMSGSALPAVQTLGNGFRSYGRALGYPTRIGGLTSSVTTSSTYVSVGSNQSVIIVTDSSPLEPESTGIAVQHGTGSNEDVGYDVHSELTNPEANWISAGDSPGIMKIDGDFALDGDTLLFEILGNEAGTGYDQLQVSGDVDLISGNVVFAFLNDYVPEAADLFDLILASQISIADDVDFYYGFFGTDHPTNAPEDLALYELVDASIIEMAEIDIDQPGLINGNDVRFQELFQIQYKAQNIVVAAVPAPATLMLFGAGLLLLGVSSRRSRKA